MPKRIILMYITEVSGHHSATLAIKKAIETIEPNAEILDINAFRYTNPISEKIINRLYLGVIKRTPRLWDYLYDNQEVAKKISKIKDSIHKFNSPKLKNLFERFKPDAVVCTQAFPCGMCADYKKVYGSDMGLVAVLTDYVPHSYWLYDEVDYYISPSEDISGRLVKKGVPAHKIRPFGIPFDPKFITPHDKQKLMLKLKISPHARTVLIMGGGQGLGPIKTIVKSLEKSRYPLQEIIVVGTNKKLYNSLKRKTEKYKNKILLHGYAQNVDELMDVADLIITKPGGVTTAEVLAKRIPMLIVKPLPGQEEKNTQYLTEKGAALKIDDPKAIVSIVDELLENPKGLQSLADAALRIGKPQASFDIARLVLNLDHRQSPPHV